MAATAPPDLKTAKRLKPATEVNSELSAGLNALKGHAKAEYDRAKGLSNRAKHEGRSSEQVAWNHSAIAYMDILQRLEGI